MNRDWRMLRMFYDDNGEEEVETRDFTEKELLEYIGPDDMREFELVNRASALRHKPALRAPEEV